MTPAYAAPEQLRVAVGRMSLLPLLSPSDAAPVPQREFKSGIVSRLGGGNIVIALGRPSCVD